MLDGLLAPQFLAGVVVGALIVFLVFRTVGREKVVLKALTYSVATRLVVEVEEVPELVVTFRGAPIKSMYSHAVVLRNVGTVALRNTEVRIVSSGGRMRRPKFHGPLGAAVAHEPLATGDGFILTCDLLNRGESVVIDVSTIDPNDANLTIIARDADLTVKSLPFASWQDAGQMLDTGKLLDLVGILSPNLKIPVQIIKKLFLS